MLSYLKRVDDAIQELKSGNMIILTDDPSRENEGDLIFPAEIVTPEVVNFMIRQGTGIVCLAMEEAAIEKIGLNFMVPPHENKSARGTPFTIPIDARDGITTGVSALDRVKTILAATADDAKPEHLVKPGHIFPLQAKSNGILERNGHTEGAVDLVKLAGFKSAAVICEVMHPDGTMACGDYLAQFAQQHRLKTLTISDLIAYRRYHENSTSEEVTVSLPIENFGEFDCTVLVEKINGLQHIVLSNYKKSLENNASPVLVRIHSSCCTGDVFGSLRCDCHKQLHYSLQKIHEEGGILFYLNQEGRGIGLLNKIKAYALQEKGYDTVEANEMLGFPVDAREFYVPAYYLRQRSINNVRLLTNNPLKIANLEFFGVEKIEQYPIPIFSNSHNVKYLSVKQEKLGHALNLTQDKKIK